MRFPPSFLDEIRARLPTSAVIGRRVKLKKQGREFAGLSPFNAEKTPSFYVNDQKGKWFDFSAQKNGDIFTFLMETEGLTFPEAVERLAKDAGVAMPARDAQAEEREKVRATLHEVMELATAFYEEALQSRAGASARGYLTNRDIGPNLQKRFRIGYAPADRGALKQHLASKNVSQEQMVEAGLLITGDDVPVSFDRFRDRVIFPIADFRGRIVGFGGRAMSSDVPAKYLNSPETDLFHKGSLLYNGAEARKAAHDADTVIAVEGYVDVIQMVGAGFGHTVAPLGTALTDRQLEILWRMADEPILCFDGDSAGVRAAWRAAETALPFLQPGKSLRFALLPEGQDPDDLIRTAGRQAMADVLAAARPLVDLIWSRETESGVFDTPERRAALEARLREIARAIGDESVRRHYSQALTERLVAFFPAPERRYGGRGRDDGGRSGYGERGGFGGGRRDGRSTGPGRTQIPVSDRLRRTGILSRQGTPPLREAVLVMTMLDHPALIVRHLDEFAHVEIGHPDLAGLQAALLEIVATDHDVEAAALRERLAQSRFSALVTRLDAQISACGLWLATTAASDEDAEKGWHQALTLHRRQRTLHKELKEAEAALAQDASEANLARLVDIQNQLASVEGMEALIEGFGASSGREARVF
ncbi:DNA primase [Bauldia litoralis]|uniref:DNA primase n=1 Tax=Bauldia litoralis TaxID=665467 RepID=A0A1G6D201_9HYPH|nr:DNA primase [Bauldia litoralis]SDB39101.1 DNA primase [Bauldia litoralis]